MRRSDVILIAVLVLATCSLFLLLFYTTLGSDKNSLHHGPLLPINGDEAESNLLRLIELVKLQNETINVLQQRIGTATVTPVKADVDSLSSNPLSGSYIVAPPNSINIVYKPNTLTLDEQDCEARYGLPLVDKWRQSRQTWCSNPSTQSKLECYPYHQVHKKLNGQGMDMFCVAYDFLVDFSKVRVNTHRLDACDYHTLVTYSI